MEPQIIIGLAIIVSVIIVSVIIVTLVLVCLVLAYANIGIKRGVNRGSPYLCLTEIKLFNMYRD